MSILYNLEIEKAVEKINKNKAKKVCLQLPDGLKHRAKEIVDQLEKETTARVSIWLGSCYGACDIPFYIDRFGYDLLIQWGHSKWRLHNE